MHIASKYHLFNNFFLLHTSFLSKNAYICTLKKRDRLQKPKRIETGHTLLGICHIGPPLKIDFHIQAMRFIKKLDIFILKNFLTLFFGTFSISLFVVLLQFSWRYIEDLVGKGLEFFVLVKFFWYATLILVPVALPLAVLLASLISMGNIGERLELLAIKAAGITLFRALRPIMIVAIIVSGISFYFQNVVVPDADSKFMVLYHSIELKSPELEIPEGVFYSGIRGNNIYVGKKNKETGMLYNVMIYNFASGTSNPHIIIADSALLQTSSTKQQLLLHLYNGTQFENTDNTGFQQGRSNVPYRRETFVEKHFIIDFDTSLTLLSEDTYDDYAKVQTIGQMLVSIKDKEAQCDSLGRAIYEESKRDYSIYGTSMFYNYSRDDMATEPASNAEARQKQGRSKAKTLAKNEPIDFDTIFNRLGSVKQQQILLNAMQKVQSAEFRTSYQENSMYVSEWFMRSYWAEIYQKISMSLACLMFFFIGAPLGAIIRKGGLGMPVVTSVLIFIFYYIVNTAGVKLGREGAIPVEMGVWLSTIILAPIGLFLTVKSNNDSAVFNMDAYREFFRKLLGIRQKRNIRIKEVIINDPDYEYAEKLIDELNSCCRQYLKDKKLKRLSYYVKLYLGRADSEDIKAICDKIDYLVDMLSNSKKRQVIADLNHMPIVDYHSFRFWRRVRNDMRHIMKTGDNLKIAINGK